MGEEFREEFCAAREGGLARGCAAGFVGTAGDGRGPAREGADFFVAGQSKIADRELIFVVSPMTARSELDFTPTRPAIVSLHPNRLFFLEAAATDGSAHSAVPVLEGGVLSHSPEPTKPSIFARLSRLEVKQVIEEFERSFFDFQRRHPELSLSDDIPSAEKRAIKAANLWDHNSKHVIQSVG